jgi:hypothetical protein
MTKANRADGVIQVVEKLPNKWKTQDSNPRTTKKKRNLKKNLFL